MHDQQDLASGPRREIAGWLHALLSAQVQRASDEFGGHLDDAASMTPETKEATMNDTPATPVEDLTTNDGSPMFGKETREYLRAVRLTDPAVIAPWITASCPECDKEPGGDGLVISADGTYAHVVLHGSVVLGCEGYFTVSPAALGLDPGQWEDWREEPQPGELWADEVFESWAARPYNAN